jgi:hypothetical protein
MWRHGACASCADKKKTCQATVIYCCVTSPRTQRKHSFPYCCVPVFRAWPRDDVLLFLLVGTSLRSHGLTMGIHVTVCWEREIIVFNGFIIKKVIFVWNRGVQRNIGREIPAVLYAEEDSNIRVTGFLCSRLFTSSRFLYRSLDFIFSLEVAG